MEIEKCLEYIKKNSIRIPIYKVLLYGDDDKQVIEDVSGKIENNNGSLTIGNEQGARRSVSMTLSNYGNEYTSYFSKLTLGRRFKLYLGYSIDGEDVLFPQGVFVFNSPTLNSNLSNKSISLSGSDKWSLLNGEVGGILASTYQVNKGSNVVNFIKETLALPIVGDTTPCNLPSSVYQLTTTYDIIHGAGETIADVLLEVAFNVNCYIYYDVNGSLTLSPFLFDAERANLYHFEYNDVNYYNATKTYNLNKMYNAVKVVGSNTQNKDEPIVSYVENKDLSYGNNVINHTILKIYYVTDYTDGINTLSKAEDRAKYELKRVSSMQSNMTVNCNAIYFFQENNVISLTDSYLNANSERFLITGITFDIGSNGGMSLSLASAQGYL